MKQRIPKVFSLLVFSSGLLLPQANSQALPNTQSQASDKIATYNQKYFAEKLKEIRSYDLNALRNTFNKEVRNLDEQLQGLESHQNLTDVDKYEVSNVLKSLGDICWPLNLKLSSPVLDRQQRMEQAKNFKLRSLNLIDKLGSRDVSVKEHRELMKWFSERQCRREEANEFLALAKILKSGDPEVIEPSRLSTLPPFIKSVKVPDSIESRKSEEAKQALLRKLPDELSAVMTFDKNSTSFKAEEKSLDSNLKHLEGLSNLTIEEEFIVGRTLNRLANLYSPLPEMQRRMFRRESDIPKVISASDQASFERAREYKNREFQLHNRLHQDITNQIRNRRALMYWYADRGHTTESSEQMKILSELLGTEDHSILNPPRANACGHIIEDDGSIPEANRATFLACGMG